MNTIDRMYLIGFTEAAKMVNAGFSRVECLGFASFVCSSSIKHSAFKQGFWDAILAGEGL